MSSRPSLLSPKGATLKYCVKIFYVVTFLLLLATIYLAAFINYVWLLNIMFKNLTYFIFDLQL